ncbi:MAG: glycosyl transferase family 9 [Candidatus Solibacter sp.]|nr:glycosyl transferase family 9 [Candidatus Solibacter sp.]
MKSTTQPRKPPSAARPATSFAALELASLRIDQGQTGQATALVEGVLAAEPDRADALYLSGRLHERAGRMDLAMDCYRKALSQRDDVATLDCGLGRALQASGSPEDAIGAFQRALALDPASAEARCNLAAALVELDRFEEAAIIARFALQLNPDSPETLGNLGSALSKLGRHDDAILSLRRGLEIPGAPTDQLLLALGQALRRGERFEQALDCLHQLASEGGSTAEVLHEIGLTLTLAGRYQEGIDWLRRSLALGPLAESHYDLCMALLRVGNFHEGWVEYEWRWRAHGKNYGSMAAVRGLTQPLWDGSPFPGRTLLLHAEQGLGDTIQFARYVPLAATRGGAVIVEVQPELKHLLASLPGAAVVVARGEPLPPFDLHCPLMSLPLAFATTLETIPPPAPVREPRAKTPRGANLRVGLVWAGTSQHPNNRNRSIPLSSFAPLLASSNISFFSFQVGPAAREIESLDQTGRIRDLAPLLADFTDTADGLAEMDLLITVDTSVAHLAGTLGVETWVLIPFVPDWRWMLDREDTPWYPSMRLFRQTARGEWSDAIERLGTALDERAAQTPASSPLRIGTTPATPARQPDALDGVWDLRAREAADFIPSGAVVLDLNCGQMAVERYLPPACTYIPCDGVRRDERTLVCDLNRQPIPHAPGATHIVALGVLDSVSDWRGFLRQLRALALPAIVSYTPADFAAGNPRFRLDLQTLCEGVQEAGLRIQASMRSGENQILIRLHPEAHTTLRPKRVAVLSYNNVGNFGDRLGFHLINSLLPAEAELHYVHFEPWDVPEEPFDMAIVGMGNSMFQPILTDRLLGFLDRVPTAIGIFGTQYRQSIDRARMDRLLDRLSIWYARHEEDALWFGRGRNNVVHLGDWMISAFPMAQWHRDETLNVGREIWQDLPLDRTIQKIQQYRSVFSTRVHPLLCALTSAETVAYREQREDAANTQSGKFRSMLLDIFGRTFAEDEQFAFNRDAVAGYRAKVQKRMAAMPETIAKLLGSGKHKLR